MSQKKPSKFATKVYKLLKTVPKGKVTTYKELAKAMNSKAYQAIGQVMRLNPYAPIIPCHRVVKSDGSIGGFSGETQGKAISKKINLLKKEGIIINKKSHKVENFEEKLFKFKTKKLNIS